MFFHPSRWRHPVFREGARDMVPMLPGIGAWGLMTGVAMVKAGMSTVEALAMTFLVYAGSAQLAAIPLVVAAAPAWVVLATGFCVNLRFVVFSLHLRPYFMHLPRGERLLVGFFTADLSYALFVRRFPRPADNDADRAAQQAYLAGGCASTWSAWCGLSLAGIGLAHAIPTAWGLGFAGVLCLIGVLCSLTNTPLRALSAAIAGACAVAAYALPLKLNVVLAIAVAVAVCSALERAAGGPREPAA